MEDNVYQIHVACALAQASAAGRRQLVAGSVLLRRRVLMGADRHVGARLRGTQQNEALVLVDLIVAERIPRVEIAFQYAVGAA